VNYKVELTEEKGGDFQTFQEELVNCLKEKEGFRFRFNFSKLFPD